MEVLGGLLSKAATLLNLPTPSVRLCTAEEWNFLANLFNWLAKKRHEALPNLGTTDSWEWAENACGSGDRLVTGGRGRGGVGAVSVRWQGSEGDGVAFRVLADLGPLAS